MTPLVSCTARPSPPAFIPSLELNSFKLQRLHVRSPIRYFLASSFLRPASCSPACSAHSKGHSRNQSRSQPLATRTSRVLSAYRVGMQPESHQWVPPLWIPPPIWEAESTRVLFLFPEMVEEGILTRVRVCRGP